MVLADDVLNRRGAMKRRTRGLCGFSLWAELRREMTSLTPFLLLRIFEPMILMQNSKKFSVPEAAVLCNWWSAAAAASFGDDEEYSGRQPLGTLLQRANELGRAVSGLSCYGLYWLSRYCGEDEQTRYACAFYILRAARYTLDDDDHEAALARAISIIPEVEQLIFFSHCPDALDTDFINSRHKKICIVFRQLTVKKAAQISPFAAITECRTKSQQTAFCSLMETHHARAVQFKGIRIRPHSLLVGMSGSGKTFVANLFARWRKIPCFSTTVGQWHLRGGTGGIRPTLDRLEELLRQGPIVLVLDEIEKFRQTSTDNGNYFRAVLDELMGVIEASPVLTDTALVNLKESTILAAGAFQDLYRSKLGDVTFAEEIEDMEPLTFEDITASGWLPDELVFRLGSLIEIRPPSAKEIEKEMLELEKCTGIARPKAWSPDGIARSLMGMRGLETYALELAKLKIRAGAKG